MYVLYICIVCAQRHIQTDDRYITTFVYMYGDVQTEIFIGTYRDRQIDD